jgi:hypothetical protein
MAGRENALDPFQARGFLFHVSVGGGAGKHRLSTPNLIIQLVAIVELDAEPFGKNMSNLGRCRCHLDVWSCRRWGPKRLWEQEVSF